MNTPPKGLVSMHAGQYSPAEPKKEISVITANGVLNLLNEDMSLLHQELSALESELDPILKAGTPEPLSNYTDEPSSPPLLIALLSLRRELNAAFQRVKNLRSRSVL